MKTTILSLALALGLLSCSRADRETPTTGPAAATDSASTREAKPTYSTRSTGEPRDPGSNNFNSGKGAPALGGEGDRRNASVSDARGSAHGSVTDVDHTNALDRPDADQVKIEEARKAKRQRGH